MQHTDLPLDVRLMTVVTRGLVLVFAVLCLGAVGTWIVRHPGWAVRAVAVQGDVSHQNAVGLRAQLAAPMRSRLQGSFLTLDLQQVRQMFEAVPWVRHARVQREFPNRLLVTLEEHQAAAWWGEAGSGQLVSQLGEVFEASPDDGDGLPELAGPTDQAPQIWSLYQALSAELAAWSWVWCGWNSTSGAAGAPNWTTVPVWNSAAARPRTCSIAPAASRRPWGS